MAKKLFVLALGVLLLVAFTAPVMAETKVEFSGHYRVRYWSINNSFLEDAEDRTDQHNYFDQRFRIEPQFIVSDNLRVVTRFDIRDGDKWGQEGANFADDGAKLERVFMIINTQFGQFRVGRMSAGLSGLYAMGYAGGMFATQTGLNESAIFDSGYDAERIMWSMPFGNFNLAFVYEKTLENDRLNQGNQQLGAPVAWSAFPGYDDDTDLFVLVPSFKWGFGQANLTMVYVRNRTGGMETVVGVAPYDQNIYFLQPAVMMNFGPFKFNFEFQYRWGTAKPNDGWFAHNFFGTPAANPPDFDLEGWGLYTDFSWTYGPGQVGLMFSYIQGPDYNANPLNGDKVKGILGSGSWHAPFLVAYNGGISPYTVGTTANSLNWGEVFNNSNYWMLGLWADHNITENLMLHAALGYFRIVELPPDTVGGVKIADWDDFFGWEADLGFALHLMDGLDWWSLFGYFWPGDYNQAGVLGTQGRNDLGSSYVWLNELRVSF